MQQLLIIKGRTNTIPVSLGYDVSTDTFVSEIRVKPDRTSDLIASWDISFLTDGTDGELILTLDDSVTTSITNNVGYMDLKRVSGGEPLAAFDDLLQVLFKDAVTA